MSEPVIASILCITVCAFALLMFLNERRAAAKRLKARGGREIDVANLIAFGSKAGDGAITHK